MSPIRLLVTLLCLYPFALVQAAEPTHPYDLAYHARFVPDRGWVEVRLQVTQPLHRLIQLDFDAPAPRYSDFQGAGAVHRHGDRVIWEVPPTGGTLTYRTQVDHLRNGAPDAEMTGDWAVARLDDLFPPVRARSKASAYARARLYLTGPEGWRFETRYGPVDSEGVAIETPGRRFDRPLGWFAAGDLGVRRTYIAHHRVAIAAPRNQGFRSMDLLVFLRWTLPELVKVAPSFPNRLLVVGGGKGMWRGGLSGPGSLYLHPDRPLVSGNATSTPLHELMHVSAVEPPERGADWIVEGLAEYYSLVILERTGGIRHRRFEHALTWLENWADREHGKLSDPSTGPDTARAVLLFHDLDVELAAAGQSLDAVVAELMQGRVSAQQLRSLTVAKLGHPSKVLERIDGGS